MEQYVRKLYEVERYHRKLAKILDGQFSVFDWHSRSIMVKDVLIEIGVVVVSMVS